MILFISLIFLVIALSYIYSKIVEKIFGIQPSRTTPAYRFQDNVDYVPMNKWKAFMIEFLDIAGLGPIFGAILGAAYGPIALLWIVLGGIFAGAVQDYLSGMLSVREDGKSIPEVVGKWLGIPAKQFMRFFTLLLMILVGASFIMGPAKILTDMSLTNLNVSFLPKEKILWFWIILILAYYFIATILPIDKIIGRIYPFLGGAMLFMALGVGISIFFHYSQIPNFNFIDFFKNYHPKASTHPILPLIFITISCGAISGFHSTQAPLMARTIKNEKDGRLVFWYAMTAETIVALIWAMAAMTFFGGISGLNEYLSTNNYNPASFVNKITNTWLGKVGAVLAILGIVAAPITSGDTALRSARLIVSDFLHLDQKSVLNRFAIAIPIFIITFGLTFLKFDALWRLMFWFNQILATIVLWTITIYLLINKKSYFIAIIPAIFMTYIVISYMFVAKEAFGWQTPYAFLVSGFLTLIVSIFLFIFGKNKVQ